MSPLRTIRTWRWLSPPLVWSSGMRASWLGHDPSEANPAPLRHRQVPNGSDPIRPATASGAERGEQVTHGLDPCSTRREG